MSIPRNLLDRGGNLAAFAVMITFNVLANAVPLGGQTTGEISDRYPSLFTPAGFTFAIWSVIYAGLLLFTVVQFLPSRRNDERLAAIGPWFRANALANGVWIVLWHYDFIAASLAVMALLLISLLRIEGLLRDHGASGWKDRLCIDWPFHTYLAWICVATIANVSALQTAWGANDIALDAVTWTQIKLGLAGVVGAAWILRRQVLAFGLVIAWAAWGIAVGQADTPAVSGGAMTLCLVMLGLTAWGLVTARH